MKRVVNTVAENHIKELEARGLILSEAGKNYIRETLVGVPEEGFGPTLERVQNSSAQKGSKKESR